MNVFADGSRKAGFGPCGEGHIRCSYATALDKLNTALEKMAQFLSRLQAG